MGRDASTPSCLPAAVKRVQPDLPTHLVALHETCVWKGVCLLLCLPTAVMGLFEGQRGKAFLQPPASKSFLHRSGKELIPVHSRRDGQFALCGPQGQAMRMDSGAAVPSRELRLQTPSGPPAADREGTFCLDGLPRAGGGPAE